jgi:hypothetical protein
MFMTPSFARDTLHLFNPADVGCMAPRGVPLSSAAWMCDPGVGSGSPDHGNARRRMWRGEFRRYLESGILSHGFARARCGDCGHDFLIAFSCKGRAPCPSCDARHMAEAAAHLADQVFPALPVRRSVFSVPKRLRARAAWGR